MVGERCGSDEAARASGCGATGSENAGMSSDKCVRITLTESLRVPTEGSSSSG
jgi:hypothetical protein